LLYSSLVKRKISLYVLAPLAILFGAYTGMIVLQQNHARFQQIISPATFLVIAIVMHRITFNVIKPSIVVVCLLLALNSVYAQHLRKQALFESASISELSNQLGTLSSSSKIVSVDIFAHSALAYALRPNKVLTVRTKEMERASILSAIKLFEPNYILMQGKHELLFSRNLSLQTEIDSPHFGNLKLYRY